MGTTGKCKHLLPSQNSTALVGYNEMLCCV